MDAKSGRRTDRIYLSAALERGLTEAPATAWRARWREENREAIAAYNEYVEQHGVFSDGIQAI